MATASSLLSEVQFQCSICLDVFTDPITTPCGHNYCSACITQHWDSTDVFKCPLCNKTFYTRPTCSVNKVFAEMADRFKKSQALKIPAKPDEVSCDICVKTKLKAVKTCLGCLASYCQTHLEVHLKLPPLDRHKLIAPVKNLKDVMCMKHEKPLEKFCKTHDMCVCLFCTESDHKGHKIVSLGEEYNLKKSVLVNTEAEVQKMIEKRKLKIQEVNHIVDLSKKEAEREKADGMQAFTALISCIQKTQAEVNEVIEEKQKTTEKQAEGLINELQKEITELEKRSSEMKNLSLTKDHLHLLQNYKSTNTLPTIKDSTKLNIHQPSQVGTARTALAELEKTLGEEIEKLCDSELRRIQQHAVDVTLKPDTEQPSIILSKDGKQVSHTEIKFWWKRSDNLERLPYLLGKNSFYGRFYYEVQVKGKTMWSVGVVRESINRWGNIRAIPNNGFWTIELTNENEYRANVDQNGVLLPIREKLQTVGVYVDYEEGLVSFYDVETRVHLYSFTGCTFNKKLYPYLSPSFNDGGKNSAPLIISPVRHTD